MICSLITSTSGEPKMGIFSFVVLLYKSWYFFRRSNSYAKSMFSRKGHGEWITFSYFLLQVSSRFCINSRLNAKLWMIPLVVALNVIAKGRIRLIRDEIWMISNLLLWNQSPFLHDQQVLIDRFLQISLRWRISRKEERTWFGWSGSVTLFFIGNRVWTNFL